MGERRVQGWVVSVLKERPGTEWDRWVQDGTILARLMIKIVFNSIPLEEVYTNWGSNPVLQRVKSLIHEMRRYGVTEMFEPEDLMYCRNIPLVTRSVSQLMRLASADSTNLLG